MDAHALRKELASLPGELRPQAAPGVTERVLGMLPGPGRVLVAGAGRGGLSRVLDAGGYAVRSVDLHPEHFRAAPLVCEPVDLLGQLPMDDDSFDLVVAVEVMEHLETPWLFFREAVRVLRPGGRLVFSTPNVQTLASRLAYLRSGSLHYFREASFRGCYHVTPIFDWTVQRMCLTTCAEVVARGYSRVDFPDGADVPRWPTRRRRLVLDRLPCNGLFGEVVVYVVEKRPPAMAGASPAGAVPVGAHYA